MTGKNLGPVIGIVVAVVLGLSIATVVYKRSQSKADAQSREETLLVRPYSPILGKPDAKVTMVEFLDPECESCRALAPYVKQILSEFPNDLRLVIRYMPLHPNSKRAAAYLEAAREQGRFAEALEILFEKQPEWGSHHDPRPELIEAFLVAKGFDGARLRDSVESGRNAQKIQQDEADGRAVGVDGTPTFFVNGKLVRELGPEFLRAAIRAAL